MSTHLVSDVSGEQDPHSTGAGGVHLQSVLGIISYVIAVLLGPFLASPRATGRGRRDE